MSHAIYEVNTATMTGILPEDQYLADLLADGWEPYGVTWEEGQRIVHLRRVVRYT